MRTRACRRESRTDVRVVGLVPARGGSKGIVGKNLLSIGGRPLLAYTIDAARASRSLGSVVVSTESSEIADAARELGAAVLDRPSSLAGDDVPMLDVVLHAAAAIEGCDALVLLQPTSPLRRTEHIDAAVELFAATGADTVVSVTPVPHRFLPESLMQLDGDRLVPLDADASLLRQEKTALYARNGPAVLVVRTDGLAERGSFYNGDVRGYVMEPEASLDIDDAADVALVEALLG